MGKSALERRVRALERANSAMEVELRCLKETDNRVECGYKSAVDRVVRNWQLVFVALVLSVLAYAVGWK